MKAPTLYFLLFIGVLAIALPTMNNIRKSPLGTQLELNRMQKEEAFHQLSQWNQLNQNFLISSLESTRQQHTKAALTSL